MSRLLNLRIEERNDRQKRIDSINEKCAEENGREPTDEERAELDEERAAVEKLDKSIAELTIDHERSQKAPTSVRPTRAEDVKPDGSPADSKNPIHVRSEPLTYGGPAGFRRFLVDLHATSRFGAGGTDEQRERIAKHLNEVRSVWASEDEMRADTVDKLEGIANPWPVYGENRSDVEMRAAVVTGDLAAVVVPQYQPGFVSRGIYPSGVTTQLLRRVPMTTEGMTVIWPRVSVKASSAIQQGEGVSFHESDLETAAVVVPVFTVASKMPLSIQAVERGGMSVELARTEMMGAHMDRLNAAVLFGDAKVVGGQQVEPAGIFYQGSKKTVTEINWDEATKANRTVTAFSDQLNSVIDVLWAALLMAPDAIVMGPTLWGKLRTWKDPNSRPLFGLTIATARDQIGIAQRVPDVEGPVMVGDFYGIPLYIDAWISNTFAADSSATTGGAETRIIVMRRDAVPVAYDPPMSYTYEQSLAGDGQVLLVCRSYAAFNAGWRPEGIRVLGGSGTAVDGGDGSSSLQAPQAPQAPTLDAKSFLASLTKAERTKLIKDAQELLAAQATHEAAEAAASADGDGDES